MIAITESKLLLLLLHYLCLKSYVCLKKRRVFRQTQVAFKKISKTLAIDKNASDCGTKKSCLIRSTVANSPSSLKYLICLIKKCSVFAWNILFVLVFDYLCTKQSSHIVIGRKLCSA